MTERPDERIDLAALAPREAWLAALPELARAAAIARASADAPRVELWGPARWFVPLAATAAVLAWWLPDRPAPALPSSAAALLGGAEARELLRAELGGRR